MRGPLLGLLLLFVGLQAWASPPPTDRAVLVLVRTLAYDRALDTRIEGPLVIGVVGVDGHEEVDRALGALEGVTVAGHPLAAPRALTPADLVAASDGLGLGALIAVPGLAAEHLAPTARFAADHDVPLLGLDADRAEGACLSVRLDGTRLKVVVAREASKAQGVRWSGELLALAERVP